MRISFATPVALALAIVGSLVAVAHADCPKLTAYASPAKIDSAPQGAPIYLNDKTCQLGTTPWTGKLNRGDYTVIIDTPGYEVASKPFHVAYSRKPQEIFIPLVKKADPPKIDVRIDADPKGMPGAPLFLDGQPVGQAPMVITTTPGRHLLEIKKDGFKPYQQWITAVDNNTQTIVPLLESSKPNYGTVVVDADVPDAEVYIDGNKHPDNTPAVIQNVIEGLHVIEVRKAPALPWKQTVQVTSGQQTKVRAELQSTLNGGVGVVRVLCDAPGARALLDGTDVGPVPIDIKDVKAGDHIVQVKAPGMAVGEKHVIVAAGQSQIVKFDLNQEQSGDMGTLKVVSSVPGAEVFIDGASVGNVPQEKKVAVGDHPVVVRLEGFQEFQKTERVEAGQTITVQADLKAVGKLRVLSTPTGATVLINGMPVGKTPLEKDVEVGDAVVRLELGGFQPWEQTLTIEGGKTQTISKEMPIAGPSEAELIREQRNLSSFGARALPRGRSTIDLGIGYPYYADARINVGAGRIARQFPFDAGVEVRSMFARTELGLGARMTLTDPEPFSAGVFSDIFWGSKLLDNSDRNGLTWDVGGLVSLTAANGVTISGRAYAEVYSDRLCPGAPTAAEQAMTPPQDFDGSPIGACQFWYDNFQNTTDPEVARIHDLTGWVKQSDAYGRVTGARFLTSILAEFAIDQHWNLFAIGETAPFQGERAVFTSVFSASMFSTDLNLYVRFGTTYKF
jgi:hypothetical protein